MSTTSLKIGNRCRFLFTVLNGTQSYFDDLSPPHTWRKSWAKCLAIQLAQSFPLMCDEVLVRNSPREAVSVFGHCENLTESDQSIIQENCIAYSRDFRARSKKTTSPFPFSTPSWIIYLFIYLFIYLLIILHQEVPPRKQRNRRAHIIGYWRVYRISFTEVRSFKIFSQAAQA